MALSIDHDTLVITVPQADLVLVGGTFYRMNSETYFRKSIIELLDNEDHMVLQDAISHNTEVTISGVTYARFIELINGYSVTFTPDSAWTVEIIGSNNNLHDVEANILNQNNVQVIPTNSAGLIVVTTGSGLDAGQDAKLTSVEAKTEELWTLLGLKLGDKITITPAGIDSDSGDIDIDFTGDGISSTEMDRQ